MDRKRWSIEEKASIVLEMIKGEDSVMETCQQHQVSLTQAYRWRDLFLEGGKALLQDRRRSEAKDPLIEENRRLKELVGSLSLIIEAQKKVAGLPPQR